jgi:hypothetical protein
MRHTLRLLFIVFTSVIYGQSSTKDPISYSGIGEQATGSHSIYNALGKNNFNFFDSTQLNFFNPASYSTLSSGNTLFSLDITSRISRFEQGTTTELSSDVLVEHFAIGFKIKQKMGLAFGLRPFSTRGYSFTERQFTGTDSLEYTYVGTGGIQNLFLGFSYAILNKKSTKLALGLNASYLFGSVNNQRKSLLVDANTSQGGISYDIFQMRAFHYEIGAFFRQSISKNQQLLLSAVVEPAQNLNTKYTEELYTASNINTPSTYDTIAYSETSGKVNMALTFKLGINYLFALPNWQRKTRILHPGLNIMLSYAHFGAAQPTIGTITHWPLVNYDKYSFGLQFNPELRISENFTNLKTLEKFSYRIGAYQQTLPYLLNNSQYFDRGMTFGLGIPILAQQSLSSVNIAFQFGQRGINEASSLKESYLGINFGLLVSPSSFDKWFRKRKLD